MTTGTDGSLCILHESWDNVGPAPGQPHHHHGLPVPCDGCPLRAVHGSWWMGQMASRQLTTQAMQCRPACLSDSPTMTVAVLLCDTIQVMGWPTFHTVRCCTCTGSTSGSWAVLCCHTRTVPSSPPVANLCRGDRRGAGMRGWDKAWAWKLSEVDKEGEHERLGAGRGCTRTGTQGEARVVQGQAAALQMDSVVLFLGPKGHQNLHKQSIQGHLTEGTRQQRTGNQKADRTGANTCRHGWRQGCEA